MPELSRKINILNSVSDLVLKPPENGKYEVLKKRLIEVLSESEDSKIRTLLQGLELGDQRPSQLLTQMRSLAGDNVGEPFLKSLWLGRLPNGTQTIIATLNENLDQLATVADKINDLAFPQEINSVAATFDQNTAQLEQQIAQLIQQVSELTTFVNHSRSPARNSNYLRNREIVLKGTKNPQMDIVFTIQFFQQGEKVYHSMLFSFGKLEWRSSPGLIGDRVINRVLLADSTFKITFLIDTDHRPLTFAFNKISDSCSPRQLRYLDFISQFSTDIRHVSGSDNSVVDALSRINAFNLSTTDLQHLADSQTKDEELKTFKFLLMIYPLN
ncbi:transposon Ty3-I Gag-Pol polyprotein [Nephila pilipes]|uniref:Transposon Ty3-I Gag-Pol polyprotein n=1 Tax=Nephila pilipes TaxID=299642 RepID=A0A8X6MDV9_NEPPI|nr:transposon Ty3-I Gag-Pol polyprotein [Nephila pilipes]